MDRERIKAIIMRQGYAPDIVEPGQYPVYAKKRVVTAEDEVIATLDAVMAMSDEELARRVIEVMEPPKPAPKPKPRPRKPSVSAYREGLRLYSDGYRGNEAIMVRRSKQGGNQ